jgi:PAS domain S-box-containing protein
MTDLMRGILGGWGLLTDRRIRLEVFDGQSATPGARLYDSEAAVSRSAEAAGRLTLKSQVTVAGCQWTLHFTKTGGQTTATEYARTWLVLFGGTGVSLLLCGLFFSLAETRLSAKLRAQRLAAGLRRSEAEALRSTRLLQAVIDHSQCLVYAKDSAGRFILASQPLAAFFGQTSHEELLGKTSHDFLPPAIADQHRANDRAVMERGALLQTEETVETPDGRLTFLSTKFPLTDARQGVNAVCGVSVDITEHKKAEAALREQAVELRTRNEELERFNRVMLGRELRVIDLKLKINEPGRRTRPAPPLPAGLPGRGGRGGRPDRAQARRFTRAYGFSADRNRRGSAPMKP